jgi:hypothetical protein
MYGEDFVLDEMMRIRAKPGSKKVIDFGILWDVLRSDDKEMLEQNKWIFEGNCKYLDPLSERNVENTGNMVAYSTYPRCGNSFLRKYLQMITGVATGADMTLELGVDIQMMFIAEEITDSTVWIKKSHDPKMNVNNKTHYCNKILCCVRNPYDTIASFF